MEDKLKLIILSILAGFIVLLVASGFFYTVAIFCGIAAWAIGKVNKDRG